MRERQTDTERRRVKGRVRETDRYREIQSEGESERETDRYREIGSEGEGDKQIQREIE